MQELTAHHPKSPKRRHALAWRVLVVDDEKKVCELFYRLLDREGYEVRTASSGQEALQILRDFPADLVITDMVMPRMDGMQLLAYVKEQYPDLDVIMATGYGTIEDAVEAMRRGAYNFITKPFKAAELMQMTEQCLRARHVEREQLVLSRSVSVLELTRSLTRSMDVNVLPSRAAELARENFEVDSATILSYRPGQESFSLLAHSGAALPSWNSADSSEMMNRSARAAHDNEIVFDVDPHTGDCTAHVPLVLEGRPRGVLFLRRQNGPAFHVKDEELLTLFASHLTIALESARLYHVATRRVSELEELEATSRTLSLCMDWEKICTQVLSGALRLTKAEICGILLVRDGAPMLRTSPPFAESDPALEAIRARMMAALAPAANPFGADQVAGREAMRLESVHRLASFISVPLVGQPGTLGLLAAFANQPECFSVEDVRALSALANNAATAIQNAGSLTKIAAMYRETIEALAQAVDAKDPYTRGHSAQVRCYARALAQALHLGTGAIERLEDGATLHDIGKISVPDILLNKPGKLTAEEFAVIKSHATRGAELLTKASHLHDLVPIVRHHHERHDGTGYPDGLRGEEIPFEARIVALADAYDAIVSDRVYKQSLSPTEARAEIRRGAGTQFDPELTEVFLGLPLEELTEKLRAARRDL